MTDPIGLPEGAIRLVHINWHSVTWAQGAGVRDWVPTEPGTVVFIPDRTVEAAE